MVAVSIITGLCLVSVYISYVAFKKGFTKSADDYFVAGSSLGYFVLIFRPMDPSAPPSYIEAVPQ